MLAGLRVKTNSSDNPEIGALRTLLIRFGLGHSTSPHFSMLASFSLIHHTVIGVE
jgi:hypothetical protein